MPGRIPSTRLHTTPLPTRFAVVSRPSKKTQTQMYGGRVAAKDFSPVFRARSEEASVDCTSGNSKLEDVQSEVEEKNCTPRRYLSDLSLALCSRSLVFVFLRSFMKIISPNL